MLLRTKLFAPHPRPGAVRRTRLLERLDQAAGSALTVISAPAGYGKTSIVSGWLQERRIPAGWYSMDPDDDDPNRFWTYLIEALRSVVPAIGKPALELLRAPVPPSAETLASIVINETAELQQRLVCVLDDYHHVESQSIHDGLIFLVENAPSNLRLVVATRSDPPWPLGRLRAERRVSELRAADLRFDEDETSEFLESAGLTLTSSGVQQLESRTDGWIAGLQMAVLSMRDRDDLDAFIEDFAGSHRFVLDYLTEEVLARQSDDVLRFLVHTSILDRLQGGLCDAVTRSSGGAEMLDALERDNLFTDPLDDERRWYRYHPLFSDVLSSRLRSSEPDMVPELHLRAAAWFETNGLEDEAVQHALDAGDIDRAARLIGDIASATFLVGNQSRLLGWLDRLPAEVIDREPTLALARAWARFVIAAFEGIDDTLAVVADAIASSASPSERPGLEAQLDAMRAWVAYMQGDFDGCIELARLALDGLPADGLVPTRIVTAALGAALVLKGELDEAQSQLERTRIASRRASDRLTESLALAIIGQVELLRGRPDRASEACRRAIEVGTVAGEPLPSVGIAQVLLGEAHRARGDLAEAERVLVSGIAICERALGLPEWVFEGHVSLARVMLASGDRERAATFASRADLLFESEIVPGGMEPLVQRALEYRTSYSQAAGEDFETAHGRGALIEPLNAREVALLGLLAAGQSNQEIADALYLSVNTVKWHARNLYGKLGVRRRTQAVERARELGLL